MKTSFIHIIGSLLRGMLRGPRSRAVAMETYLHTGATVQKMIDSRLIGINLKERHVVIDEKLHRAMMPQRFDDAAIRRSDRRYAALMDKVVAYMNMQLGRMGKKEFIDPQKDTVTFHVTIERRRYVDENGNPLPAHRQVEWDTLLVGVYRGGEIDYKAVE